jgi:putative tricarboxylic transport membrane protein
MIVPFEPGGGSDVFGRTIAAGLEEVREGVNVSVENRAGGSGAVGYSYLLEQSGNPHFLLASETAGVALPVTADVPFKPSDFTAVAQVAEDTTLIVVPQDSKFRSLPDVIDAAKDGKVTVAVSGATGLDAVVTTLTERDQNVKFERVVFESGGEIVNAALGGDVDAAMLNPSEVIGQLRANKMRALAVYGRKRYEGGALAEVPTAAEEGVDVSFTQYRGLLAAGGIKPAERRYWEEAVTEWTKTPSFDKYVKDNYLVPVLRRGKEFETYLQGQEAPLTEALGK